MPEPPRVTHLDDIEAIAGPGSLTWRPVRLTLGIKAFGCNAYTAEAAGQDVVESHTEAPESAHEELYFVAAGRASFTIDGQDYDAPAGTYVFIPDPASRRYATATEPHTTVLSFGGPPAFVPSAWEWTFQAGPLVRTDHERARAILTEGLQAHPEEGSLYFGMACVEAVAGDPSAAIDALRTAIERRPETAQWAREDEDLAPLRDDPRFQALLSA